MADYVRVVDEDGCLLTIAEYISSCLIAAFTDDDGYGHPVKDSQMDTSIHLFPSKRGRDIPEDATHVVWFNR